MAGRCGRLFFVLLVLFPMHMLPISLIIHFLYLSAVVLVDTDFETYIDMIYNWNLVKPWQWYNDLTPSQAEHSLGFTMGYMWTLLAIVQVSILRSDEFIIRESHRKGDANLDSFFMISNAERYGENGVHHRS